MIKSRRKPELIDRCRVMGSHVGSATGLGHSGRQGLVGVLL